MRCRRVQRAISDEIDGCPAPGGRRRLEKHLEVCPSCREYREGLRRLESESARTVRPAVPPGYWEDSLLRLREALASVPPGSAPAESRPRPFFRPTPRWAWAAAPALLVIAAAVYLAVVVPSGGPLESFPLSHEEGAGRLAAMVETDEALEADFSALIQAAIVDDSEEPDGDIRRLLYAESRFLDGLSEDELRKLETHIASELKI